MWGAYAAAIEKHVGSKLSDPDAVKLCGLLDRLGSVFSDSPTGEQDLYAAAEPKLRAAANESALIARATVWRALDTLAPRRRAVVVMHELEGLPIASIAGVLGISAVTVRWHLSLGRRELAQTLERHGGRHDHR